MVSIVVIVFLLCIIVSELPYHIGIKLPLLKTFINPSDLLGFIGDFLTFIGTVSLGMITIHQTKKANDISKTLLTFEQNRIDELHKPIIGIKAVTLHNKNYFNETICKLNYAAEKYIVSRNFGPNRNSHENATESNNARCSIEIELINIGKTPILNCRLTEVIVEGFETYLSDFWIHLNTFSIFPTDTDKLILLMHEDVVEMFAQKEIEKITVRFECKNTYLENYQLILTISGKIKKFRCMGC